MEILAAFIIGMLAGGAAVALYYRRAAIELARLKEDVEARVQKL